MGAPSARVSHRQYSGTAQFRNSSRSCQCNIKTIHCYRGGGCRLAIFQARLECLPGKIALQYHVSIYTSLTNKPKARLHFTVSSDLHILPASNGYIRSSLRHVNIKIHHSCPIHSIPQPLFTPSTSSPEASRLRRLRPPTSSLRSSNHSSCIFSFTSHTEHY